VVPSVSRFFQRRRPGALLFLLWAAFLAGCAVNYLDPNGKDARSEGKDIVILQSDTSPAFVGVARALSDRWKGSITVLTLNGNAGINADALRRVQRPGDRVVVAVGLPAAQAVRKLSGIKAIFCQVFNYEDYDLVTPWMKGVSATPPLAQQFQVWKKIDPNLTRVAVITGPRLNALIAEAQTAAEASGIEIKHVQVSSDLETQYAVKKLDPKIQALWLLPDNRVLSRNTIRDLLSYGRKQGKQVAVFSAQLLPLGGMMSFDSVHSDIAEQVIARSVQALESDGTDVPGPPMRPLTRLDTKINPIAVKQLGLKFPSELKGSAYVP
jgi:ABC-type uncharacterized transport system substrate-binding protein